MYPNGCSEASDSGPNCLSVVTVGAGGGGGEGALGTNKLNITKYQQVSA